MDVVPVTGQPWDTNPFEMVEKGDRLYGRGTTDMKGYLACMLAMVPEFKRDSFRGRSTSPSPTTRRSAAPA